jgi:CubicO group peptidase (beta-lactamase class C family)
MGNSLNIRFVSLEDFNQLQGVDGKTSSQICHGLQDPNLVAGKYWSEDSVLKTGEDPKEVDPSYTTNAVDCSAGILIANGVKLHSHMKLHFNCHRNLEQSSTEAEAISHLEKEFPEQLEGFFGHLDQLIRAGQFNGETISLDLVLGGGLVDAWDKDTDDFTPKMLENSPILKDKMIEMVQTRLAQTEELAAQHGAKLDYSRSIFWGQKIIKPDDKSISYFTNMHYDPSTNTLSINARKGHPNPNKLERPHGDPDGGLTRAIDHVSDSVAPSELDDHYSQIELGISHISTQAAEAMEVKRAAILAKIESHIDELREQHGIPGLALNISTQKGDIIISSGTSDVQRAIGVGQETQFMIGSTTKLFTATMIMQLVEEDKLDLDKTIAEVLPHKASKITNADKITVRHLLQHTSGLADPPLLEYDAEAREQYSDTPGRWDSQAVTNSLEGREALFEPGATHEYRGNTYTRYEYNNAAYGVLGAIIEEVEGKPLEQVLKEKIADPLELKHTQFGMSGNSNLATAYTKPESLPPILQTSEHTKGKYEYGSSNGNKRLDSTSLHKYNQLLPQGGLISSPSDMQTFIKALFESEKLLKKETVEQMCSDSNPAIYREHRGHLMNYGLGTNIEGPHTETSLVQGLSQDQLEQIGPSYGHAGNLVGYQSDLKYYPDHGMSLALNTNLGFSEITDSSVYGLVKGKLFSDPEIFEFLFGSSSAKRSAAKPKPPEYIQT